MRNTLPTLAILVAITSPAFGQGFNDRCAKADSPLFGDAIVINICADGKPVRALTEGAAPSCPELATLQKVAAYVDSGKGDNPAEELFAVWKDALRKLRVRGMTECQRKYLQTLADECGRYTNRLAGKLEPAPTVLAPVLTPQQAKEKADREEAEHQRVEAARRASVDAYKAARAKLGLAKKGGK